MHRTAARIFRQQLQEEGPGATGGGGDAGDGEDVNLDNVEHPEISRQRNLTLNAVAILQHQRGNYGHALTLYNKVIQSETTMAQLHDRAVDSRFLMNRGDTYLKLNQLQQVAHPWPHLGASVPGRRVSMPCCVRVGACQALADFHRAYDTNPRDLNTRRRLAVVHDMFGVRLFNDGLVAQAEVEFSTAIDYSGNVALYHLHRGNAAMYLQVRATGGCCTLHGMHVRGWEW